MKNEKEQPALDNTCASCGTALQGKYCHACGEKQLDPHHDFSVLHFLEETFESFTHLDSKVIRSYKNLFFRPGFLCAEFMAGRRVRYMKPVPLFLVASVLFYLFFPTTSSFFSNPADMCRGYEFNNRVSNTLHLNMPNLLAIKAKEKNMVAEELIGDEFRHHAASKAKTWLFFLVPIWGLVLWALFGRKYKWLVPHLVFALHGVAFFILFDLISLAVMSAVGFKSLGDRFVLYLAIAFTIYCVIAIRTAYGMGRAGSVLTGLLSAVAFFALLAIYRQLITYWAIWEM
ncbi:MAG: DUF3667 domain-containing protein [Saprospiraceae bacterium]|nr:DUF3667 domain-containing protein [Saprospiraceae bacterium]